MQQRLNERPVLPVRREPSEFSLLDVQARRQIDVVTEKHLPRAVLGQEGGQDLLFDRISRRRRIDRGRLESRDARWDGGLFGGWLRSRRLSRYSGRGGGRSGRRACFQERAPVERVEALSLSFLVVLFLDWLFLNRRGLDFSRPGGGRSGFFWGRSMCAYMPNDSLKLRDRFLSSREKERDGLDVGDLVDWVRWIGNWNERGELTSGRRE